MPRLHISVSEALNERLSIRAEQSGATLSQTATVLLDLALSLWEPDESAPPRPSPRADPPPPNAGPREPHVMKNRFAEKCPTLDLVDGVCPTCGYRES